MYNYKYARYLQKYSVLYKRLILIPIVLYGPFSFSENKPKKEWKISLSGLFVIYLFFQKGEFFFFLFAIQKCKYFKLDFINDLQTLFKNMHVLNKVDLCSFFKIFVSIHFWLHKTA